MYAGCIFDRLELGVQEFTANNENLDAKTVHFHYGFVIIHPVIQELINIYNYLFVYLVCVIYNVNRYSHCLINK